MTDGLLHEEAVLLNSPTSGDVAAVGRLFATEQLALTRFVAARLNKRLARRLDAADVVQDIFVLAMCRLSDYLKER